eukprot:scaffold20734_cov66-Cyclotella_meneghiniana.AAC.7
MDMNPPKQRRNRKKKESVLSPQAAREEAELRMKIQQSLQNQFVDRANREDSTGSDNPVMMYGQMGICGAVGEQNNTNTGGMNYSLAVDAINDGMGMIHPQQFQNPSHMPMSEMDMYEMQLEHRKMMLAQKMNEMQRQQQQGMYTQNSERMGMGGMSNRGRVNNGDIMRELKMKQEQLLQMGLARKHMEELSRRTIVESDSDYQQQRGFSNESNESDVELAMKWYNCQKQNSRQFSNQSSNESNESDAELAMKWYNYQKQNSRQFSNQSSNESNESDPELAIKWYNYQKQNSRQFSNQSGHSQDNFVDLTGGDTNSSMHQYPGQSLSPINQHTRQFSTPYTPEMEAIMRQQMMEKMMMQEMQRQQSPSPHLQAIEHMMNQEMTQLHQMMKNQQNNQYVIPQAKSPGKSKELVKAMMGRVTSEPESESGLESLLSMPSSGKGSVRDSMTVGDIQDWFQKERPGKNSMGFYSVGNDMSASFGSVMGDSDRILSTDAVAGEGSFDQDSPSLRTLSNRDTGFDLAPIDENDGDDPGNRNHRISMTVNDLKETKRAPALGEIGQKNSLDASGMSLSLGDFGEGFLDSQMQSSLLKSQQGFTPNSMKNNQSEMMMSMDSLTYSALLKVGNESNSEIANEVRARHRDLSEVVEGDDESRTSSNGQLMNSQGSNARSRTSNNSRPSVVTEISQWSKSNPFKDDDDESNDEEGNTRQKSLGVDELEAVDLNL